MSNDYLVQDIPWDDEEQLVDREPAGSDGRTHYGHLQLYALKVAKSWEAGQFVTIPNVKGGDYNEKDEAGLMKFKGWRANGDRWLFVLVATKQSKEGQDYQIVKQYKGKPDKSDEGHDWGDFVYPALKALTEVQRAEMRSRGLYCQWSEIPTGRKFEPADGGEKRDITVWTEFKPFASKEEMEKASQEFFAQFSGNGTEASAGYPWKPKDVELMIAYGVGLLTTGQYNGKPVVWPVGSGQEVGVVRDVKLVAQILKLVDSDGKPLEHSYSALCEVIDKAELAPPEADQLKTEANFLDTPY